ncbi:MAG TPA: hypothetical protein ENF61_01150 [Firmicutes bacterium]|nr:hypothetical protein [Bacillota bacterium]
MEKLILKNARRNIVNSPVKVEWEGKEENLVLLAGEEKIYTQKIKEKDREYLLFICNVKEGETKEFKIEKENQLPSFVSVKDDGKGRVDVFINEQLFTSYHYSEKYARPFLNPVIGPGGKSVVRKPASEGNPENFDHIHHRGIWVAHGDVNGVDNWSEMEGHGKTIHRKFLEITSGVVFGKIHSLSDWVNNKGEKILEEEREIIIYNLPADCRIIDHKIILRATEGEVVFKDTKESGLLSVRVAPSMEVRNTGRFENSYGGINEEECWGKRAFWCDYYGEVDGIVAGIAIFDHPSNLRYPTWWHVRNYGLMTANFFGLSDFYRDKRKSGTYILPAYEEFELLYRIYIHSGNTEQGKVKEKYLNFLFPPEIEIK